MAKQEDLDKKYLQLTSSWAEMSQAVRRKVGCIIVRGTQIISDGFNGMPSGFDNNCEDEFYTIDERDWYGDQSWIEDRAKKRFYKLVTKPEVLHAESNALMKLARSTNSSEGATMYLTCAPCFNCAKLIIQSGIVRVVYQESYTCLNGVVLLQKANIIVEQMRP
jgi:dCMP deaminase